ncbi:Protein of unknown function [Pyronema omphalodes CBS 100304]|uniref:Uncharacterized protein n=1 Tax=Pyronema omphalodes (strain CBS 100304) TaxID=1076935 RepID=U4LQV6_PYROM|nr:Protein of unknown function [Pyronema omphalodes CBS 100304]
MLAMISWWACLGKGYSLKGYLQEPRTNEHRDGKGASERRLGLSSHTSEGGAVLTVSVRVHILVDLLDTDRSRVASRVSASTAHSRASRDS